MNPIAPQTPPDWEIFCRVVDNYGDIGVCWRLARMLAATGTTVRLWVDDWSALGRLCPAVADATGAALLAGVELRQWSSPFPAPAPGANVIEAFACELPSSQVHAMARCSLPPAWINLEYLSAEDWVAGCHRLASPHPALGLVKHFFFPGFDGGSGGLLREPGLLAARDRYRAGGGRAALLQALGLGADTADALVVSLFAYEQPALAELLGAWRRSPRPLVLLVPEGRVLADLAGALGGGPLAVGERRRLDALQVAVLPFSDQDGYDRLLWSCDLNFVRGEDSFVRAQWAAAPFVWQIYRQPDDAHADKLDAFLARYAAGLDEAPRTALGRFWKAWNGEGSAAAAWPDFAAALPLLADHTARWSAALAAQDDLATQLKRFCNHIRQPAG
ncbi:hypothetical protein dqs_0095 [Azoarcus olearius]|uniref:elongation factor P maturation arginine rhamnosyltransferase EarP n=1 Tax=Azoarcus sp. (strain BH72) TaxID=418699 RepID=UPI0008061E5A|nr:elongation factor P maturation arginine rhamnosyltransferase EarP [Azoarcus olearius]ANQ83178.1 hypothetical protein dqs_0095 [Azoarcus olearius]